MSAPRLPFQPTPEQLLIFGVAYLAVLAVVARINPGLAFLLLFLGIGAALILLAFKEKGGTAANEPVTVTDDEFSQRLRQRHLECARKEEQFRSEASSIRRSMQLLREDLERSGAVDGPERTNVESVLKDYDAEFNLRLAKAAFFADCGNKIKAIQDRYVLQRSINAHRKELDRLRSRNFDDEATLEETRYHLERDAIELDAVLELSREAFVSFKAEQAEELRQRLEKLRGEL